MKAKQVTSFDLNTKSIFIADWFLSHRVIFDEISLDWHQHILSSRQMMHMIGRETNDYIGGK